MSARLVSYHGTHPLPPKPEHEKLEWGKPYASRQYETVRVRVHTCGLEPCVGTFYELCTAGGQGFIRRTTTRQGVQSVAETPPMSIPDVERAWWELMHGRAR